MGPLRLYSMLSALAVVLVWVTAAGQEHSTVDFERSVLEIAHRCEEAGRSREFLGCVLKEMRQDEGLAPVAAQFEAGSMAEPPGHYAEETPRQERLLHLLRNFSCARDSATSDPLELRQWTWDRDAPASPWILVPGQLMGDAIGEELQLDERGAQEHCERLESCDGFTYEQLSAKELPLVQFQTNAVAASRDFVVPADGWHSQLYVPMQPISHAAVQLPRQEYTLAVLHRSPDIVIVRNFTTTDECNALMQEGGAQASMRHTHKDMHQSRDRQAFSSDIQLDSETARALMERKTALMRNLTGYNLAVDGQEPLNAVLYANPGDEYMPHCDGWHPSVRNAELTAGSCRVCDGTAYPFGERVATSILYCRVADGGGQTSFTRAGLMVNPEVNMLLVFTYKHRNGTMDHGLSEHSSCPLLRGQKWVANQWYREGVDALNPWHTIIAGFTASQRVRVQMAMSEADDEL